MQKLMGLVRRCADDYGMISKGDGIAAAVSGGKDSIAMLCALAGLREFHPSGFSLEAITLDMGMGGSDYEKVSQLCERLEVRHTVVETRLGELIFELRKEKNPCSLCSKMRRAALNEAAQSRGIKKIALAHNYDDAVETFLMSLLFEGRISCFQPVTYLDRTGITQIRPMLYVGESMTASFVRRFNLPVVANPCPANGFTKRQQVKELVAELGGRYPGLKTNIFGAMQRLPLENWAPEKLRRRPLPEEKP